jgi:hypothetical protein
MDFPIYFWFECIALIFCAIFVNKAKHSRYIYFLPYLIFITIYEYGSLYDLFLIDKHNLWITNYVITIEFLFYSFFLISALKNRLLARRFTIAVIACLIFTFIDIFLIEGFAKLCSIAILIQFILLITLVCVSLYQLMQQPGSNISIISIPDFWVNTGLIFFCLAEFLFFTSFAYMAYKKTYDYYFLFSIISNVANVILYSCITISFLCISQTRN